MPKPDWQSDDGSVTLYCADCRAILPLLEPGSVDAVVTDPPYGIGWSRGAWDDSKGAYPELIVWLVAECRRIVVAGWCFVFQAMPNCGSFSAWFPEGYRIFAACKNFAQIRPTGVWHSWDPVVFWNSRPNSGPNSDMVNRDYHVGNVAGVFGEKSDHPCPRPVDTMRHIVGLSAATGAIVLDPFMGSGTTGVACIRTGRRFVGIEIERKYFDVAVRRCQEALLVGPDMLPGIADSGLFAAQDSAPPAERDG